MKEIPRMFIFHTTETMTTGINVALTTECCRVRKNVYFSIKRKNYDAPVGPKYLTRKKNWFLTSRIYNLGLRT